MDYSASNVQKYDKIGLFEQTKLVGYYLYVSLQTFRFAMPCYTKACTPVPSLYV